MHDRDALMLWMTALENYARDWDATFENRPTYFTQEFWYMLVGCLRASWLGRPMTVSQLVQAMKSGSARTREERIRRAVGDGYLMKVKSGADGRATVVIPTPMLEEMLVGHLDRTLTLARDAIGAAQK